VFHTRQLDLPDPLPLDSGRALEHVRIAYEAYGQLSPARDNVILVCHALSGDAHAAGWSDDPEAPSAVDGFRADERGIKARGGLGWWDGMIGPGKAFDTDRYYVVCTNLIGSCRGSTGPSSSDPATGKQYGPNFPVVTVGDMVRAEKSFLDVLGIDSLLAIAGGSLGGMRALEWSVAYPRMVRAVVSIASTAHLGSQGVAWNAIASGVGVARMVGHITYLSAESMREKFDRRLQDREQYSFTLTEPDFAVESYLRHQADTFAGRFDANSYLYISRALTYFDLARDHGAGSLQRALAHVAARYLLISFSSDWLYPPHDSRELEVALRANGKQVEHHQIEANYGHDSFLLEEARQAPIISAFLEEVYSNYAHG
jgi:homoserine O-acetyltransferase